MAVRSYQVEAEVLSINEHVFRGKLIGGFLSGSSGWFNDKGVIIAIRFEAEEMLILHDLEVSIAELMHYKDRKTIPIDIEYQSPNFLRSEILEVYFRGRRILKLDGYYNQSRMDYYHKEWESFHAGI